MFGASGYVCTLRRRLETKRSIPHMLGIPTRATIDDEATGGCDSGDRNVYGW